MRSKVLFSAVASWLALVGCGSGGTAMNSQTGGAQSTGGQPQAGGAGSGGTSSTGGTKGSGGTSATGGNSGTGGSRATGGAGGAGGITTTRATGGAISSGGRTGSGGQTAGGSTGTGTGGVKGTGGTTTGTPGIDAGAPIDGGAAVNCAAEMPTSGGKTYTGANVYGTINGLNYGIWTNGVGGTITVFPNINAFSASWNESKDFLAHLGLDFNTNKPYTAYGTITANIVEKKNGTAGGFSMIGMYGWMHSPCIEWYINEDAWNGLGARGTVTATIDGGTYYLTTLTTTGTGGANACESGHTGSWTQMISTRKGTRQCGTITVSDHFAAWEKQGWTLGSLRSVHINVEVGGGVGSIDFPVAEVTTTSK